VSHFLSSPRRGSHLGSPAISGGRGGAAAKHVGRRREHEKREKQLVDPNAIEGHKLLVVAASSQLMAEAAGAGWWVLVKIREGHDPASRTRFFRYTKPAPKQTQDTHTHYSWGAKLTTRTATCSEATGGNPARIKTNNTGRRRSGTARQAPFSGDRDGGATSPGK